MASSVFGVIAPHPPIMVRAVGGSRADITSASVSALSDAADALAAFDPETLVLMSPHSPALADAFVIDDAESFSGTLGQFGDATEHHYPGDPELARALLAELSVSGISSVARSADARLRSGWLDHASIVPLSFLEPTGTRKLVVVSLSYLPYAAHRALGASVNQVAATLGRRVAFIASGDMSHRLTPDAPAGYSPRAADLDAQIVGLIEQGRLASLMELDADLVEAGGECGLRSFIALGGYCCEDPAPTRVLSYEGPWGVGYLTALVGKAALDEHSALGSVTPDAGRKGGMPGNVESDAVSLARQAIDAYVREGERIAAPPLSDPEYPPRAGAFVSLHREGRLRGCIGTIGPTRDSLAEEIVGNAIEAATRDPRFPPLAPDELGDLDIKVDVLHPPESCSLQDLDPSRFGVITTSGWRRGLLLPDLEGVDDVATQVQIAMQKAGIDPGEPCAYERFKVDRYT